MSRDDVAVSPGNSSDELEAGDDFIQKKDHILAFRQLSESLHELCPGRNDAPVSAVAFVQDAGGIVFVDRGFDGCKIVRRHKDNVRCNAISDAGHCVLNVVRWIRAQNETVVPAVKVAGELDDFCFAGGKDGDS